MKNWKRRYFQLDENTIGYFKSELVRPRPNTGTEGLGDVTPGCGDVGGSLPRGGSCLRSVLSGLFPPGQMGSRCLEGGSARFGPVVVLGGWSLSDGPSAIVNEKIFHLKGLKTSEPSVCGSSGPGGGSSRGGSCVSASASASASGPVVCPALSTSALGSRSLSVFIRDGFVLSEGGIED